MSVPNYVYRATVSGKVADEIKEVTQLFAATNLRKALVKTEKWIKAQQLDGAELVSLTKEQGVVI